ncbi:MAG: 2,3-bisphosphoglycerate-independent phosphoglycerate mutase [Candidatus Kerfeldbacteria bacterium]|nr:2,3-bisphosphoglycerate-independent phosphoglycerate mutase [Candidatus Kerfeldbacteria bacterium]
MASHSARATTNAPFVLIILDGWGIAPANPGNAIALAHTPTLEGMMADHAFTTLRASGSDVGLPPYQVGNSEAGHLNIGAGRIVKQDAVLISEAIRNGTFFKNPAFIQAIRHVKRERSSLHLMGLLTDVHSGHAMPDHLRALLRFAKMKKMPNVALHLFTDGRDTAPREAKILLNDLQAAMKRFGVGHIATVIGRQTAMDRVKDWGLTLEAYHALTVGASRHFESVEEAVKAYYREGITDEFFPPTSIVPRRAEPSCIRSNDAVIFFNLRSDRARQLTKPFVQPNFEGMNPGAHTRKAVLKNFRFIAMTDFGPDLDSVITAFPSPDVPNTLPKALESLRQLYIAEATKFAHMTYFFNGGYKDPVNGEKRLLVPSKRVERFDSYPQMSTPQVTRRVLTFIRSGTYDFIGLNFANADMVAHTGNIDATIRGCEVIDASVKKIVDLVLKKKGCVAIVGDHGNAEVMMDFQKNELETRHNSNPVPFFLVTKRQIGLRKRGGRLANIAPTILEYLGLRIPPEMTEKSVLTKHV